MYLFLFLAVVVCAVRVIAGFYQPKVQTHLPQLAMALMTPGPLVGEVSGRIGGTVFSHNRGGMYIRNGVKPTKVVTSATELVRGVLSVCSRAWGELDDGQQEAWHVYALANPVVNRLGQKKTLAANAMFNSLNTRLLQAGEDIIMLPPTAPAPSAPESIALTLDSSPLTASLAITPSPIGTGLRLLVWTALLTKPGQSYVGNKWKLILRSEANAPSPVNLSASITDRYGEMQAGYILAARVQTLDVATGLVSGYITTTAIFA